MASTDLNKTDKRRRTWRFIKKILIWATVLYLLQEGLDHLGWGPWSKIESSIQRFDSLAMIKMQRVSPISLVRDLRSDRSSSVIDTAARNEVERYNSQVLQKIARGEYVSGPAQKGYSPKALTFWEKIQDWARGFWYNDDNSPNWFGRTILIISLLLAIPITRLGRKDPSATFLATRFYPVNTLSALFCITIYFTVLYVLMNLILLIAGSIVAFFSTFVTAKSFAEHVWKELSGETMTTIKEKVGP